MDASVEGYQIAGFSGGEPTLYKPLPEVIRTASELGYVVTVTTNGTTLTPKLVKQIGDDVNLIAVSLDGVPESHNIVRRSPTAFQRMDARISLLRDAGIPFGFIFTLTQYNLNELPWVVEYALKQRAGLLQIHPLEPAGRAATELSDAIPDEIELSHGLLLIDRLMSATNGKIRLQIDLADRANMEQRDRFAPEENGLLADAANPLIIESSGIVVPGRHGLSQDYAIGNLHERPLRELKDPWLQGTYQDYRALQARALDDAQRSTLDQPFFNWYALLAEKSRNPSAS